MRLAQAWLVARHELSVLRRRRTVLYALVGFPLGVAIGFPVLVAYIVAHATSAAELRSYLPALLDGFSFWFVVASATLPVNIASYSIVGEKTEKSLEPLLATPTTDGEILLGKALAAFLPTLAAIGWAGTIFMVLIDRVTRGPLGYLYFPNLEMGLILLVLAPLAGLLAIEVIILISARLNDVRSAQQVGGIMFLPFVLLYVVGVSSIVPLDAPHLLYISGVLAAIALVLSTLSRRSFDRDNILTRWR